MMITAKPTFTVLVAATIFLTIAGPLPLCLPVLRPPGSAESLALPLLILIRGLGLLLPFRLSLLLRFRSFGLLLSLRLGLLFRPRSLGLLLLLGL